MKEVVREPDFTRSFNISIDGTLRRHTPTFYLRIGFVLRNQNQLPVYADFSLENVIKFVQKSSLLEGEAIIAWTKRLFSNDPPIKDFRIESDAKSIVNFLIDEAGCNDVNLIDFKRNFVVFQSKGYMDKWGTQWNCT